MTKTTAVLLAGGKGTRFDPDNLKTLHLVDGIPLTELVIKDINKSELFDEVILVYNTENEDEFLEIAGRTKVIPVKNGDTRFKSAFNGMMASTNEKIIFIDVAAPFYQHKMLINMINKLDKFSGVMTTILDIRADHVHVVGEEVVKVFNRGEILRVKSYQAILKTPWLDSYGTISDSKRNEYTEMLKMLLDTGKSVGNVISENNPRKLTTKDDLRIFKK